jgi:hypothetical protein
MTSLPPEVVRACELLREVVARPGAKARIYRRITAAPKSRDLLGLRYSVVTVGLMLSASAALGFGLASRIEQPFRSPAGSTAKAAPTPGPPRQAPRGAKAPASPVADAKTVAGIAPEDMSPPGTAPQPSSPALVVISGPPAKAAAAAMPVAPAMPSELSQQVADYREAVAKMGESPTSTLDRLRAFRRKWPQSALLHEVDLRIVQVLVSLGRAPEAEGAAQRFLQTYPNSARVTEVRRIAEATSSSKPNVD